MDLKKIFLFVIIIGLVILAIGGYKYISNQPEKFDSSKSENIPFFGRNDLGNMLNVNIENARRAEERKSATTIMVIGAIIAILGGVFSASTKSQQQQSNPISSNSYIFCSNCGKKYSSSSAGNFCNECGNKL